MFVASKVETNSKLTFTKADIQAAICAQLVRDGYTITVKNWNESNTKFEVIATKPEKKGGK